MTRRRRGLHPEQSPTSTVGAPPHPLPSHGSVAAASRWARGSACRRSCPPWAPGRVSDETLFRYTIAQRPTARRPCWSEVCAGPCGSCCRERSGRTCDGVVINTHELITVLNTNIRLFMSIQVNKSITITYYWIVYCF